MYLLIIHCIYKHKHIIKIVFMILVMEFRFRIHLVSKTINNIFLISIENTTNLNKQIDECSLPN